MVNSKPITEHIVSIGETKLTYTQSGKISNPVVIFIHSLTKTAKDWLNIIPAFSDDYFVIAVNLRGHGKSDWQGEYSFENMAHDIKLLIDELKIDKPVIIGHSLGGIVAYFLAALYPNSLSKLVIEEGPPPRKFKNEFSFGNKPKRKLNYDWQAVLDIVEQINNPEDKWWQIAGKINVPALIISGGASSHVPVSWNKELSQLVKHSKCVVLKGGHFVHEKHPQLFITEVKLFLNNN